MSKNQKKLSPFFDTVSRINKEKDRVEQERLAHEEQQRQEWITRRSRNDTENARLKKEQNKIVAEEVAPVFKALSALKRRGKFVFTCDISSYNYHHQGRYVDSTLVSVGYSSPCAGHPRPETDNFKIYLVGKKTANYRISSHSCPEHESDHVDYQTALGELAKWAIELEPQAVSSLVKGKKTARKISPLKR